MDETPIVPDLASPPLAPPLSPSPPAPVLESEKIKRLKQATRLKSLNIRAIIIDFLDRPQVPLSEEHHATLCACLQGIHARQWRQANLVGWVLGRVPQSPAQLDKAVFSLSKMAQLPTFPDLGKLVAGWTAAVTLPIWLFIVVKTELYEFWAIFGTFVLIFLPTLLFTWLSVNTWRDSILNRLRLTAVESLGLFATPPTVTSLAMVVCNVTYGRGVFFNKKVRTIARAALPKALASLTSAHYLQMEPNLVPALCMVLQNGDEAISLQILEALGRMGDGRAVPIVERLGKRSKSVRVKQSANDVLPILQKRQMEEQAHSTLLRASQMPGDSPDVLLRPAQSYSDTPAYLLRPVGNDSGDVSLLMDSIVADFDTSANLVPDPDVSGVNADAGSGFAVVDIAQSVWDSLSDANSGGGGFDTGGGFDAGGSFDAGGFDSGGGDSGGGGSD